MSVLPRGVPASLMHLARTLCFSTQWLPTHTNSNCGEVLGGHIAHATAAAAVVVVVVVGVGVGVVGVVVAVVVCWCSWCCWCCCWCW